MTIQNFKILHHMTLMLFQLIHPQSHNARFVWKQPLRKVSKLIISDMTLLILYMTIHYVTDLWNWNTWTAGHVQLANWYHSKEKPQSINICKCNTTSHYNKLHIIFCQYASVTWNGPHEWLPHYSVIYIWWKQLKKFLKAYDNSHCIWRHTSSMAVTLSFPT